MLRTTAALRRGYPLTRLVQANLVKIGGGVTLWQLLLTPGTVYDAPALYCRTLGDLLCPALQIFV